MYRFNVLARCLTDLCIYYHMSLSLSISCTHFIRLYDNYIYCQVWL